MSGQPDRWATDRALASRGAAGDPAALDEICRTHYGAILQRLERLTGVAALAEDLAQETFLRAISRLTRYRGEASLQTWLTGIAFNAARGYFAVRRRRRLGAEAALIDATLDDRPTPDDDLTTRRARLELYQALDHLPETQRQAFVLRYLEEVPLEEAAEILHVPISTVSYRARRAEQRLIELLRNAKEPR